MEKAEKAAMMERLRSWGEADARCERKLRQIERLRRQADEVGNALGGTRLTGGAGMDAAAARTAALRDSMLHRIGDVCDEIAQIRQSKMELDEQIERLPEELRRLLELRYERRWSVSRRIPATLHVDARTVTRWHDKALERLKQIQEESVGSLGRS